MKAEGSWTYNQACSVIKQLLEIGVDASITIGGIWLDYPEDKQGAIADIIRNADGRLCDRTTQEWISTEITAEKNRQWRLKNESL